MAGATALLLPYPTLGDPVRVPTDIKNLADAANGLFDMPYVKLILPSNFPVANNSNTVSVPFPAGSEALKSANHPTIHSTTVNNTRIIPPRKGVYLFTATSVIQLNTSGFRTHTIGKNGVRQAPEAGIYTSSGLPSGANAVLPTLSTILEMNGTTDYAELFIFQNSGGALNAIGDGLTTTTGNTIFTCTCIRRLP
jgi:hypothetical protein